MSDIEPLEWEDCPQCSGTGDLSETLQGTSADEGEPCYACDGDGEVPVEP